MSMNAPTDGHSCSRSCVLSRATDYFVAVHIGAGYHSKGLEQQYKQAMSDACCVAADHSQPTTASELMQTVSSVITVLEDCPLVNAGRGSNLTESGVVECDASVMAAELFGACGAVRGVQNPIQLAEQIASRSQAQLPLGRVPPIFLAGDGARLWALRNGVPAAATSQQADQMHITDGSIRKWHQYRSMLAAAGTQSESPSGAVAAKAAACKAGLLSSSAPAKRAKLDKAGSYGAGSCLEEQPAASVSHSDSLRPEERLHDTAGCVYVSRSGMVAAGVSSGGIALKADGRIGEAAMHGCGCWAASGKGREEPSVACSVTGVGEPVMRSSLAKVCCMGMMAMQVPVDEACSTALSQTIQSAATEVLNHKDFGMIAVRAARQPAQQGSATSGSIAARLVVEFAAVHSACSMGFAFMTSQQSRPSCSILRQAQHGPATFSLAKTGHYIAWDTEPAIVERCEAPS